MRGDRKLLYFFFGLRAFRDSDHSDNINKSINKNKGIYMHN